MCREVREDDEEATAPIANARGGTGTGGGLVPPFWMLSMIVVHYESVGRVQILSLWTSV